MKSNISIGSAILISALILAACRGGPSTAASPAVDEPDGAEVVAKVETSALEEAGVDLDDASSEQEEARAEAAGTEALMPDQGQRLEFTSEDGTALVGSYWPGANSPSPGVILMHQQHLDREQWHSVVTDIRTESGYAVLAFDFRGHGESDGQNDDWPGMIGDARAALRFFTTLPGVDPHRIVMMGTGFGADAAVDSCVDGCVGSISLSPGSFLRAPYKEALLALNDKPVLCVAAEDDHPGPKTCRDGVQVGLSDYQTQIYHGRFRGIAMFDIPDQSPNLIELIMEWLAEHI